MARADFKEYGIFPEVYPHLVGARILLIEQPEIYEKFAPAFRKVKSDLVYPGIHLRDRNGHPMTLVQGMEDHKLKVALVNPLVHARLTDEVLAAHKMGKIVVLLGENIASPGQPGNFDEFRQAGIPIVDKYQPFLKTTMLRLLEKALIFE